MSEPRVRKTYQEKLKPTPTQERQLEAILWRCRTLYNAALEQRITWWRRGQGRSVTRFQQEAELKAIREAYPEYAAIHSHVLQDVLARLDKTYQAFFRQKYSMARTAPSGSPGDGWGGEPRTRGALAPAECQESDGMCYGGSGVVWNETRGAEWLDAAN